MTGSISARRWPWQLALGPLALALGLFLLKLSDILLYIGPLDRAAFGWSVPIPLILAAPGLMGVAARWSGIRTARRVAVLTGTSFGVALGIAWFLSLSQVGCDPHPGLATRLLASLPIPLVLGVGWALAGWVAAAYADRPVVAFAAGAGIAIAAGVVMFVAWALFFPGVTCTPGGLVPVG